MVIRGATNGAVFNNGLTLTVVGKDGASIGLPPAGEKNFATRVNSGSVYFRDVLFSGSSLNNLGVTNTANSTIRINRCRLSGFPGTALAAYGGYEITNSIFDNSAQPGGSVAVYLDSPAGAPRLFAYNTVTNNNGNGVGCGLVAPDERANLITDSLSEGTTYACFFPRSLIGGASAFDPTGKPFHLTAQSPCRNWSQDPSPPMTDIDGDARPAGQSDCGADEFVP